MAYSPAMKYFLLSSLLSLPSVLSAAVPRQQDVCTFFINAEGALTGSILESTIGEPRIGGTFPQNSYLITDGIMTDSLNHTCVISLNTSQLQCTSGLISPTQISFDNDFYLLYGNTTNWLACPANGPEDDGSYNIFSDTKTDKTGCKTVQLHAGGFGCSALGRPGTTSSTVTSALISTAEFKRDTNSSVCPNDISSGIFQFPHLIIPTSPEDPDYAFGNSYTAYISPINTTLFNFDIPATAPYTSDCALVFQFPYASQLDPSAPKFYFSGIEEEEGEMGGLDFALLSGAAIVNTTYSSTPNITTDYGKTEILPGNNYTIATFPCKAGTTTYSASSKGNVELDYFQDSTPSAIGLYIVPCI